MELGSFRARTLNPSSRVWRPSWEDFIPLTGSSREGLLLKPKLHSVPACQAIVKKRRRSGWAGPMAGRRCRRPGGGIRFSSPSSRTPRRSTWTPPARGSQAGLPGPESGRAAAGNPGGGAGACSPATGEGCVLRPLLRLRHDPHRGGPHRQEPGSRPGEELCRPEVEKPCLEHSGWTRRRRRWTRSSHGSYDIWGGDIDPAAVELSRHNAALAGVEDCVRFEVADAGKFHRESAYGQLVTNPPYGERL